MEQAVQEAVAWVKSKALIQPRIGVVLGSGLSAFSESLSNATSLPYEQIPHFPTSSVAGHRGELVMGTVGDVPVAVMSGRVHFYEGYEASKVAFPVRVLAGLGISTLVVTNASGACNPDFEPGQLMLIEDHINFTGNNPLVGPNVESFGARFPDMSEAYSSGLRSEILRIADDLGVSLQKGTYIGVSGPSYETPAEILMFHRLGADAVGMSTVYEVIAANHQGLDVAGIAVITNMGAGLSEERLNHEDVKKKGAEVREKLCELLSEFIRAIPEPKT